MSLPLDPMIIIFKSFLETKGSNSSLVGKQLREFYLKGLWAIIGTRVFEGKNFYMNFESGSTIFIKYLKWA